MWADVDIPLLGQVLMPEWWRRPRFVAFIRVLVSPVRILHEAFKMFRNDMLYSVTHTGQIMSIEHRLNDRFDGVLRRIYITDQPDPTNVFVYRIAEAIPGPVLYPLWQVGAAYPAARRVSHNGVVYSAAVGNAGVEPVTGSGSWTVVEPTVVLNTLAGALAAIDFVVHIPDVIPALDQAEIRAVVDLYRLAGKLYTIELI